MLDQQTQEDTNMNAEYQVSLVECWKTYYGDFVVALRGPDGKSIVDDTGFKEESEWTSRGQAVQQAKRLAKHYKAPLFYDKTFGK